jgi:hypothetical protein
MKLVRRVFLPERHDGVVKAVVNLLFVFGLHDLAKLMHLRFRREDFVEQASVVHELADFEENLVFGVKLHFPCQIVHF